MNFRLSNKERNALKNALAGFDGEAYLFGSRLYLNQKGGDIDILLKPKTKVNPLDLSQDIQRRFWQNLEQRLDVVVFNEKSLFCQEIVKHAKPLHSTDF